MTREDVTVGYRNPERILTQRNGPVSWRGLFEVGAVAAAAADIHEHAVERVITAMTLFALIPLFSVVGLLLWRGGRKLSIAAFTQLPPAPLEQNGGFGNAILGTLVIVGMATLISVPIGILSAIFLAQAKPATAWRPRCASPPKC